MLEMDRFDFVRCARPCFDQTKHTLVPGECWLGGPDLSQPCPHPDCLEDGCKLADCCQGLGCDCEQRLECFTEVADYYDDGTVQRYCREHKSEWIADR